MRSIGFLGVLFASLQASATPLQYEVVDVFSSIRAGFELADGSDSGSLYVDVHGDRSTTLTREFDLGKLRGTQTGSVTAFPALGTVRARGASETFVAPLVSGNYAGQFEPDGFWSWGKHVVVGRFVVPDVGRVLTEVYLDVQFSINVEGQALFLFERGANWNPSLATADGYTPWRGISEDRIQGFRYRPGELVYFAFGVEPGVGGSGQYPSGLTNSDSADFLISISTDTPIASVPEPTTAAAFSAGLLLMAAMTARRRLKGPSEALLH